MTCGRSSKLTCQCPLGLLPHFYFVITMTSMSQPDHVSMPSRAVTSFLQQSYLPVGRKELYSVNALSGCYLISTYGMLNVSYNSLGVNALSGCYLISTVPLQKPRFYAASRACFCRYLSEYSDNSCFSCMLTIWTYFMRYTYP